RLLKRRKKNFRITLSVALPCASSFTTEGQLVLSKFVVDRNASNNFASFAETVDCQESTSPNCEALTTTVGTTTSVSTVSELNAAIQSANSSGNSTILLADGTYTLSQGLMLSGDNLMLRSASGNRAAVVIQGDGMSGGVSHIFWVTGDNITIADMKLGNVANHAIQVHGEQGASGTLLHNLHIFDTGEQMVKGSYDDSQLDMYSVNGNVSCSLFEYTAGVGPQYYIGGIDVHHGKNWLVRDNVFKSIRSPEDDIAEHAVHFWSDSEGTVVERNKIINCDRGIGFGLGSRGHQGGIIRNNFIYHDDTRADVGIGLENAVAVKVLHNTIFYENSYQNAIEYRFAATTATIANNLTNRQIALRDGATGSLTDNVTSAQAAWFEDAASGDLHLLGDSISEVDNQGTSLSDVTDDFDQASRASSAVDIGADER
ncbi:hypothetical protein OAO01_08925, partial [Oligoflexia bacterium]|nr:hypothetical protein [Oligoflexia bacterium]